MAAAKDSYDLELRLKSCKTIQYFGDFVRPVCVRVDIAPEEARRILENYSRLDDQQSLELSDSASGILPNGAKKMMKFELPRSLEDSGPNPASQPLQAEKPQPQPQPPTQPRHVCGTISSSGYATDPLDEQPSVNFSYAPTIIPAPAPAPAPASPSSSTTGAAEQTELGSSPKVRDKLFQRYVQALFDVAMIEKNSESRIEANKRLWEVFDDFQTHVMSTTETWFKERGLRESEKTLKETYDLTRGAGGVKILCGGDFIIKIPEEDHLDLYRGHYWLADKTAKHEHQYSELLIPAIYTKLLQEGNRILVVPAPSVLVDYLGHRVLVALFMDMEKKHTVGRKGGKEGLPKFNPDVAGWVNDVLEGTGLKRHKVTTGFETTPDGQECALPCDAEVLRIKGAQAEDTHGLDAIYGIVDCARLAVAVPRGEVGTYCDDLRYYLVQHMRRELTERYFVESHRGLSCDAFLGSKDGYPRSLAADNNEVRQVYQGLQDSAVQRVTEHLCGLSCEVHAEDLVWMVHNLGLNLRHLGRVYDRLIRIADNPAAPGPIRASAQDWCQRIKVEVAARTFRRTVNETLRKIAAAGDVLETTLKKQISVMYNLVLGNPDVLCQVRFSQCSDSRCSSSSMSSSMSSSISSSTSSLSGSGINSTMHDQALELFRSMNAWKQECFPVPDNERDTSEWLKVVLCRDDLLRKGYLLETFLWVTSNLLGVQWVSALWQHRSSVSYFNNAGSVPFNDTLVLAVRPRVVQMNAAYHSLGMVLDSTLDNSALSLEQTVRTFRQALDRQPTNTYTMIRLARTLEKLAEVKRKEHKDDEAQRLLERKRHLVSMAAHGPNPPSLAFFTYALQQEEDLFAALHEEVVRCGAPVWGERATRLYDEALEAFTKAKEQGDKHACFMLADLMRVKGVCPEEMLKCFDSNTDQGANTLNHLFVLLLEQQRWSEAAEVAAKLKNKSRSPEFHDEYIIQQVDRFIELLQARAQLAQHGDP